ncbi:MAG: AtpZ/AtpI family protein [Ignavibacteria bacterium]|nr:AtpZ/AtpI family protein [Ignavibacteria bacterium]
MENNKSNKNKLSSLREILSKPIIKTESKTFQYSGLGIQLSATILIFLFIGVWLDKVFETKFLFTLILTFIGFGGGFYSFYLTIKRLSENDKKMKDK